MVLDETAQGPGLAELIGWQRTENVLDPRSCGAVLSLSSPLSFSFKVHVLQGYRPQIWIIYQE